MTADKYPLIKEVALSVALAAGLFNRLESQQWFFDMLEDVLNADNVYAEDLAELEVWLGALNAAERDTLADGEESEMRTLVQRSPLTVDGLPSALLFEAVWEALCQ